MKKIDYSPESIKKLSGRYGNCHGDAIRLIWEEPYRCPVCEGRGTVSAFFYEPWDHGTNASTLPVSCRSCNGTGVLWQ